MSSQPPSAETVALLKKMKEESLLRHYSRNLFLCENGTKFTLFRENKVVTYAHGRTLQIGDSIEIRRFAPTQRDAFNVRVIQIDNASDFMVLQADCDMFVHGSAPSLHLPRIGCNFVVCTDKDMLSYHKVDVIPYTDHPDILGKGFSKEKPLASPEGGGCYQADTNQLGGICVGWREIKTEIEGKVSCTYEFNFCAGGVFF